MSDTRYDALPKAHTTYANIIKSLLPIGDSSKVSKDVLPSATYSVDDLHIDQSNLNDYRKTLKGDFEDKVQKMNEITETLKKKE